LVVNKKPTGYISEIHNLVPACGKCNQSKGNKDWQKWMVSDAALSPKSKGVADLEERMERLEKYEQWSDPTKMNFEAIVGKDIWEQHWKNWERVQEIMKESQNLAKHINVQVMKAFKGSE
jgi:hypothetical protein